MPPTTPMIPAFHCLRHRPPVVWALPVLLFLLLAPTVATAAETGTADEAAIRSFHRRVSEIKRMMGGERPVAKTADAGAENSLPHLSHSGKSAPAGEMRHAAASAGRTSREGKAATSPSPAGSRSDPTQTTSSSREMPREELGAAGQTNSGAPVDRQPWDVDHLQLRVVLAEDRLRVLEGELSATRRLAVINLVLLVGALGWGFRLHWRRNTVAAVAAPVAASPAETTDSFGEGIACYRSGRLEEALEHFDRVLAAEPAHLSAYLHRGNIFVRLRQFDEAFDSYLRMFELDPGNRSARLSVAELFITAGQYRLALQVLKEGSPNRRGPESVALSAFFEFAARCLSGMETAEVEARFEAALSNHFVLTWSLREVVRWLRSPDLPEEERTRIITLLRQLQARGGRLAGFDAGDESKKVEEEPAGWPESLYGEEALREI